MVSAAKKGIVSLLLLLLASPSWGAIKAYLNQTTVHEGDPVVLTIESDQRSTVTPSLDVLNKDFDILHVSQGSQARWDNGVSSYTKSWTIRLLAKHKGEISIPVIHLGQEATQPLSLLVSDIPAEQVLKNSQYMKLEASVEVGENLPYVQQQIPYVIKLYTDASITKGEIFAPNIDNALIEKLSRDKRYSVVRNGQKLNVLERHYVISAEKSGTLVIPPAIFKGEQVIPGAQRNRRDGFSENFFNDPFFNTSPFGSLFEAPGKPVTTRSDVIEIAIQPIPSAYKGASWLPAEGVVIEDSWNKATPAFQVGEPTVRTLTLRTKGLTGSQIPDIEVANPPQMRVYEDKANTQTKTDGKTVFGIRQQAFNYIPDEAGIVTVPAVTIDWWNVVTKQQETFTLAERKVEVLAGVAGGEKQKSAVSNTSSVDEADLQNKALEGEKPKKSEGGFLWLALTVLGVAVITLLWFLYRHFYLRRSTAVKPVVTAPSLSSSQLLKVLQKACEEKDKKQTASVLLQLAKVTWPNSPPKSLGVLASRLAKGGAQVKGLDKSLYSVTVAKKWQAGDFAALWDAVKEGFELKKVSQRKADEVVADLYPHRH